MKKIAPWLLMGATTLLWLYVADLVQTDFGQLVAFSIFFLLAILAVPLHGLFPSPAPVLLFFAVLYGLTVIGAMVVAFRGMVRGNPVMVGVGGCYAINLIGLATAGWLSVQTISHPERVRVRHHACVTARGNCPGQSPVAGSGQGPLLSPATGAAISTSVGQESPLRIEQRIN